MFISNANRINQHTQSLVLNAKHTETTSNVGNMLSILRILMNGWIVALPGGAVSQLSKKNHYEGRQIESWAGLRYHIGGYIYMRNTLYIISTSFDLIVRVIQEVYEDTDRSM